MPAPRSPCAPAPGTRFDSRRNSPLVHPLPLVPCPEASEECLTRRYSEVFSRLCTILHDEDEAAFGALAAYQEGHRLLERGVAFTMTPENRAGRLWIAATRAVRRWHRRQWTYTVLVAEPSVVPDYLEADRIHLALAALPEQYRLPVELRFFCGQSLHETAEEMGLSIGQVRSRLRTALRRLEKLLRPS